MKIWTEYFLIYFKSRKSVTGMDSQYVPQGKSTMLNLVDSRKTQDKQLWICGCSTTYGAYVEKSERYGEIISKELGLQASWLAHPGSSIEWAADQILRSDIRPGDTLIWGITDFIRFPYYKDDSSVIEHVHTEYYSLHPEFNKIIEIDRLLDQNLIYRGLTNIYQVINFCKKLKINFVLAGIHVNYSVINYFLDVPNFIYLQNDPTAEFLDFGYDGIHPGPKTHRWYADEILNFLKNNSLNII